MRDIATPPERHSRESGSPDGRGDGREGRLDSRLRGNDEERTDWARDDVAALVDRLGLRAMTGPEPAGAAADGGGSG